MKDTQTTTGERAASELVDQHGDRRFYTFLADPPWQFQNRTGKVAPEHKRLNRYDAMTFADINQSQRDAVLSQLRFEAVSDVKGV